MHHLRTTSKIIESILFKYQRFHSFTGMRIYFFRNFAHFSSIKDNTKAGDNQSVSYKNSQKLIQEKVKEMKIKQQQDKEIKENTIKGIKEQGIEIKETTKKDIKDNKDQGIEIMKNMNQDLKKKMEEIRVEFKQSITKEKKTGKILLFCTIGTVIITVLGFITGIPSSLLNYQLIKKQQQIKKEFSQQSMDDGQSYFDGKYVETQIKTILDSQKIKGRITLLMGVPGIGKSVTIKKYIKKQRENGRKVYYFNLKNRVDDRNCEPDKLIFLMETVFDDLKNKNENPENNTDLFVIDDINIIENPKLQQKGSIIQNLCILLRNKGVTVVLISSSTSFFYNVWRKQLIAKSPNLQYLINEMKDEEFNQVLEKKAKELGITDKIVIDKVKDLGLTMRQSLFCLLDLKKEDQTKALSIINRLKKRKQLECYKQTQKILEQKYKFPIAAQIKIINIILQFKTGQDVDQNYILLNDKIKEGAKQLNLENSLKIQKALDDLDDKNLIIFGTPRSKLIRRAMENYLNTLKEQLKGPKSN